MYYPADRNEHAAILGDLAIYGNHAPHLRYRQQQLRASLTQAQTAQETRGTAHMTLRERIGARLIAWGMRIEGCSCTTVAHSV